MAEQNQNRQKSQQSLKQKPEGQQNVGGQVQQQQPQSAPKQTNQPSTTGGGAIEGTVGQVTGTVNKVVDKLL